MPQLTECPTVMTDVVDHEARLDLACESLHGLSMGDALGARFFVPGPDGRRSVGRTGSGVRGDAGVTTVQGNFTLTPEDLRVVADPRRSIRNPGPGTGRRRGRRRHWAGNRTGTPSRGTGAGRRARRLAGLHGDLRRRQLLVDVNCYLSSRTAPATCTGRRPRVPLPQDAFTSAGTVLAMKGPEGDMFEGSNVYKVTPGSARTADRSACVHLALGVARRRTWYR